MKTLAELLADHPFFRDFSAEHLELLSGCASQQHIDEGDFLFREGEVAKAFYIVRHGSMGVTAVTPHQGLVTIQTLGEGEVLGWSWLLPPYRWHFGARALEPAVVVGLDAKCIRDKCDRDAHFGYEVMRRFAQVMASRLEATHLQLMNVYEHRG